MARPTLYSPVLAVKICERIALGEPLRAICRDDDMPGETTVRRWLSDDEQFRRQYAHAREEQAEHMAEEIVAIADDSRADTEIRYDAKGNEYEAPNNEWMARSRLRVDTRKWLMSKLAPKKYGEKIDVTTGGESLNLSAEDRAAKLTAIHAAAAKRRQDQEDGNDLL